MASELEKILGEDPKEVTPPLEPKEPAKEPEVTEESPEVKAASEKLANIKRATADEEERLREIRKKQKLAKAGKLEDEDEDELPVIDLKDPSARAWDKRIKDASSPVVLEMEKAKDERRIFALRQFLTDKPSLAKNPQKLKAMMETYDRLKTSTELTSEGIMMDLEKAYAAEHSEELIAAVRSGRVDDARNNAIFSDIAVTRGSTTYQDAKPAKTRTYTEDEKAQLAKWGMTPAEHAAMVKEQEGKSE